MTNNNPPPFKRIQVIFNEKEIGAITIARETYNLLKASGRDKDQNGVNAGFTEVRKAMASRFGINQAGKLWLYFPERGDAILNN